ncbi:hypothetical protein DFH06DRAFT_1121341 [Mycena polygramma]|nr:hypothetical protein DFH06DRAFT_1121341 [Mycena polygramma]
MNNPTVPVVCPPGKRQDGWTMSRTRTLRLLFHRQIADSLWASLSEAQEGAVEEAPEHPHPSLPLLFRNESISGVLMGRRKGYMAVHARMRLPHISRGALQQHDGSESAGLIERRMGGTRPKARIGPRHPGPEWAEGLYSVGSNWRASATSIHALMSEVVPRCYRIHKLACVKGEGERMGQGVLDELGSDNGHGLSAKMRKRAGAKDACLIRMLAPAGARDRLHIPAITRPRGCMTISVAESIGEEGCGAKGGRLEIRGVKHAHLPARPAPAPETRPHEHCPPSRLLYQISPRQGQGMRRGSTRCPPLRPPQVCRNESIRARGVGWSHGRAKDAMREGGGARILVILLLKGVHTGRARGALEGVRSKIGDTRLEDYFEAERILAKQMNEQRRGGAYYPLLPPPRRYDNERRRTARLTRFVSAKPSAKRERPGDGDAQAEAPASTTPAPALGIDFRLHRLNSSMILTATGCLFPPAVYPQSWSLEIRDVKCVHLLAYMARPAPALETRPREPRPVDAKYVAQNDPRPDPPQLCRNESRGVVEAGATTGSKGVDGLQRSTECPEGIASPIAPAAAVKKRLSKRTERVALLRAWGARSGMGLRTHLRHALRPSEQRRGGGGDDARCRRGRGVQRWEGDASGLETNAGGQAFRMLDT